MFVNSLKITFLRVLAVAACSSAVLQGAWNGNYVQNNLNSSSGWTLNGTGWGSFLNNPGFRNTNWWYGSAISGWNIPQYAPNVDASALVQLTPGNDNGTYIVFVSASSNANHSATGYSNGTYIALVATANVTANSCYASLSLVKAATAGVVENLGYAGTAECVNNQIYIELVLRDGWLLVYNFGRHQTTINAGTLPPAGLPGVGGKDMGSGSAIIRADFDRIEYGSPTAPAASAIAVTATATQVDFAFPGAADDPNGKGVAWYALDRAPQGTQNFTRVGELVQGFGQYSDRGVTHSTAYTYRIWVSDFHSNLAYVDFNATTAPQGTLDPRQVGLPPTAPTYGALGANINLLSGNVNYNMPLLRAQARGGWSVGFSLNHDTQSWRKTGSQIWKHGVDTGYGFGWKLMAGSVMRYYKGSYETSHIVFTDAAGTEYRLDRKVQADGTAWASPAVWDGYWAASTANFYGIFQEDWSYYRMKFPDGSSWFFGSHSAGTENDFGAAYPTTFVDSNGNQLS
jgi:hypothetical protein